jgi:hypothetical protein
MAASSVTVTTTEYEDFSSKSAAEDRVRTPLEEFNEKLDASFPDSANLNEVLGSSTPVKVIEGVEFSSKELVEDNKLVGAELLAAVDAMDLTFASLTSVMDPTPDPGELNSACAAVLTCVAK